MIRGGMGLLTKAGFRGEREDWEGYARWLGLRHDRRIWGEVMSNAMAVIIRYLVGRRVIIRDARRDEALFSANDEEAEGEAEKQVEVEQVEEEVGGEAEEGMVERVGEEQVDRAVAVRAIARKLGEWGGVCLICKAKTGRIERGHGWRECM